MSPKEAKEKKKPKRSKGSGLVKGEDEDEGRRA